MSDMKLLLLSDIHSGSLYAPMPARMKVVDDQTGDERIVAPSKAQQNLLALWKLMVKRVGKVDVCLVNGDVCDGVQRANQGAETWTSNLDTQVEAAVELLQMIDCKAFRITMGSPYHTGENMPCDKVVAKRLDGVYGNDLVLDFKKQGVRFHCSHYVGTARVWQYATTSLARDMLLLRLNRDVKRYGDVDWCIRSHSHAHVGVLFGHTGGFTTPGWQTRTPYAVKHGLITPPDIGWILLTVKDDGTVDITDRHVETVHRPSKVVVEG